MLHLNISEDDIQSLPWLISQIFSHIEERLSGNSRELLIERFSETEGLLLANNLIGFLY
jgi:hypothetical protein